MRDRAVSPRAAEICGQGPCEQELGVRGQEEPDPAVCLLRGPHLRGGEAENALEGADRVLKGKARMPA